MVHGERMMIQEHHTGEGTSKPRFAQLIAVTERGPGGGGRRGGKDGDIR